MSTFNGIVKEFPNIRIDNFTANPNAPPPFNQPPLACFLSHVHSDHLRGLESRAFRSPFVYCTAATREVLLRLEKYPHRMNFAKGILESRRQTYRHLKTLLKPIPLESPTVIKLSGNSSIQVTLYDANHCVGSCMFLIEGDGKAILYTGDVRSELWWRLDMIYLDTTFAFGDALDMKFPPKRDGLSALLHQVEQYDPSTLFYLDAWTFGYEEVWLALATKLNTRVHLDRYRYRLYCSVQDDSGTQLPGLLGFKFGNHYQQGCLTDGTEDSEDERDIRIHSCEREDVVRVTPIITRHNGIDIAEVGAGGGQGDMDQIYELELDDITAIGQLIAMTTSKLHDNPQLQSSLLDWLSKIMMQGGASVKLDIGEFWNELQGDGNDLSHGQDLDNLSLDRLIPALARLVSGTSLDRKDFADIKRRITFPFSRHSSYEELRHLVAAFQPKDVYPCTVDHKKWTPEVSMETLFGDLCSTQTFLHDKSMHALTTRQSRASDLNSSKSEQQQQQQQQQQLNSPDDERHPPHSPSATPPGNDSKANPAATPQQPASANHETKAQPAPQPATTNIIAATPAPAAVAALSRSRPSAAEPHTPAPARATASVQPAAGAKRGGTSPVAAGASGRAKKRKEVEASVLGTGGKTWAGLRSVSGYHNQEPEREL
ncbi:hypothetical protein MBLNU459_g2325t2 [Dothideomycetes sp. NU459]